VAPLSAQVHDGTLKGSGTNASPLGVNIPLILSYNNCGMFCSIYGLEVTTTLANTNAVYGSATSGSGVFGTASANGNGVTGTSVNGYGVSGASTFGAGVYGQTTGGGSGSSGVWGYSTSGGGTAVYGQDNGTSTYGSGVLASTNVGTALEAVSFGSGTGVAIQAWDPNAIGLHEGFYSPTDSVLNGNVYVSGTLSKSGGSFKIDHPSDPANKYLSHSFVESPDMMNVYNGNIHTDAAGNATVKLPDWFETLNRDFRYQLTVIGQPAQAWVASKVTNNRITIKTDKPNVEVSWQVTGIRQDAWANAHRIPVEEEKSEKERGFYLHPELHGQSAEKGVMWARYPEIMQAGKERRQARAAQPARP
jgi:hypothetical protein